MKLYSAPKTEVVRQCGRERVDHSQAMAQHSPQNLDHRGVDPQRYLPDGFELLSVVVCSGWACG